MASKVEPTNEKIPTEIPLASFRCENGECRLEKSEMVLDPEWRGWNAATVASFLRRLGGYAAEAAHSFEKVGVTGEDLSSLDDSMLRGIGVENAWHRYKVLDAIKVMTVQADKEAQKEANTPKSKVASGKERQFGYWDVNKDGAIGLADVTSEAGRFWASFKNFAFSKSVQGLVVGMMIGQGLKTVASSFSQDILLPLIISPWAGSGMDAYFVVISPSCSELGNANSTSDVTCDFASSADAKAKGAATFSYGNFVGTFIDFVLMALFVFVIFRIVDGIEKAAQKTILQSNKEFEQWQRKNKDRLNIEIAKIKTN